MEKNALITYVLPAGLHLISKGGSKRFGPTDKYHYATKE
jgi:hypothetical protein